MAVVGLLLSGQTELRTGAAVRIDDAIRQQIGNTLSSSGSIGAEDVVEGMVLANDDDHMLYWRAGLRRGSLLRLYLHLRNVGYKRRAEGKRQCKLRVSFRIHSDHFKKLSRS